MKKLKYITILRALAILAVLVVHVRQQSAGIDHLHPFIISIMDNGARGVQLFYILSAFTLFLSFSYRNNNENTPIKNYFIRRFFRIAPLYYLAIIYYLWQDGTGPRYWLGNSPGISLGNIISNFTFTHGFSPYWIASLVPGGWSVAIEVVFYCMLPLLFRYIKNLQQAVLFTLATLLLRFVLLLIFERYCLITDRRLWSEYLFLYLPNQLPVFSLGIILYYLLNDNTGFKINSKTLLAAFVMLAVGISIQHDQVLSEIFYFGLTFLLLIIALQRYQPWLLFNPIFTYIGNISYTIYLTHWSVIYFVNKYKIINIYHATNEPSAFLNFILNYTIILSLTIVVSTMLYYTVELPMQKAGSKLIKTG